MKRILLLLLMSVIIAGCDKDDEPLSEKETLIKYCVKCNTPNGQMHIYANGLDELGLYVKGGFEKELYTKSYFAVVEVKCDDPKALIHVDLYVNKKKRASRDGNRSVYLSERLKGKGPYLE